MQQEVSLEVIRKVAKGTQHNWYRLFVCGTDRVQEICEPRKDRCAGAFGERGEMRKYLREGV